MAEIQDTYDGGAFITPAALHAAAAVLVRTGEQNGLAGPDLDAWRADVASLLSLDNPDAVCGNAYLSLPRQKGNHVSRRKLRGASV